MYPRQPVRLKGFSQLCTSFGEEITSDARARRWPPDLAWAWLILAADKEKAAGKGIALAQPAYCREPRVDVLAVAHFAACSQGTSAQMAFYPDPPARVGSISSVPPNKPLPKEPEDKKEKVFGLFKRNRGDGKAHSASFGRLLQDLDGNLCS